MIPDLRDDYNRRFDPRLYQKLLDRLNRETRTQVGIRTSETPCFFPKEIISSMADAGAELTHQLIDNPEYMRRSVDAIPERYRMPGNSAHPNFMTVDFGLIQEPDGSYAPRLVELQAFPSIYAYQAALSRAFHETFSLDGRLRWFLSGLDEESYWTLLRQVIVGQHDPEQVVLAEIEPDRQKTLPDFHLTQDRLGIRTVDISQLVKQGSRLFYRRGQHGGGNETGDGSALVPIRRIYNRAIVDELERKNIQLPFDYRENLDVEWAGHPNWYFQISKFSIPWLDHPTVPRAVFLSDWYAGRGRECLPEDRGRWILKPLYSFAGKGIVFEPSQQELDSIPAADQENYLLQERVSFAPVIDTPFGPTQAEVRILYLWPEEGNLVPVLTLVRMGRGKMMGVDHNRDQQWVGSTAGYYLGADSRRK